MIISNIEVQTLGSPKRIIDYVLEVSNAIYPSRSSLKKAFKKGLISLNGAVATEGQWVKLGDHIKLSKEEAQQTKIFPLKLKIIYEDDYLAIIDKPAGFAVSGNYYKTIQNALAYNLKPSEQSDGIALARPAHRLDKLTSGLLLIAKCRKAQASFGRQFEEQAVSKTYLALVKGKLCGSGAFDEPIEGQEAYSQFTSRLTSRSLSYGWISLIELKPKTGRTHQLRIHLAKAGHPIIGDYLYDEHNVLKGKGLFLNASKLSLTHPQSGEKMTYKVELPAKFEALINKEKNRWHKFNSK